MSGRLCPDCCNPMVDHRAKSPSHWTCMVCPMDFIIVPATERLPEGIVAASRLSSCARYHATEDREALVEKVALVVTRARLGPKDPAVPDSPVMDILRRQAREVAEAVVTALSGEPEHG